MLVAIFPELSAFDLQFLHEAGLSKKWAIADVFGLDPELLAMLEQPVLSLLLLFPINEKVNELIN